MAQPTCGRRKKQSMDSFLRSTRESAPHGNPTAPTAQPAHLPLSCLPACWAVRVEHLLPGTLHPPRLPHPESPGPILCALPGSEVFTVEGNSSSSRCCYGTSGVDRAYCATVTTWFGLNNVFLQAAPGNDVSPRVRRKGDCGSEGSHVPPLGSHNQQEAKPVEGVLLGAAALGLPAGGAAFCSHSTRCSPSHIPSAGLGRPRGP